jgi:hypothetical protein
MIIEIYLVGIMAMIILFMSSLDESCFAYASFNVLLYSILWPLTITASIFDKYILKIKE